MANAEVRGYVVGIDEIPKNELFQADIIQLRGTVHGSKGRGYLNYLTLGGGTPGQAWNMARVQERASVPVWIGRFQNESVIVAIDKSRLEPNGFQGYRSPLFAQHAPDHRWGSGDTLYVNSRQIEDLMVRPGGSFTVKVNPGWYGNGLGYVYFPGLASLDLASYQPATGTKRYVGLYLGSANTVQVVAGGIVAQTAVPPEPVWPDGAFRLAAPLLYGSKSLIDFEYIKQRKAIYSNPVGKVSGLYTPDGGTLAWSVDSGGNLDNPGGGIITAPAAESVFKVKNTSGATAAANEIGYLSELGEYKTTTTAGLIASWCVVAVGGANNADIYVANRGRFTVKYTGTAPSAGHYLTTSTVAGSALRSTIVTPAIMAVCLAAGSGGTVEVLLLCNRTPLQVDSSQDVLRVNTHSGTDFVSTISGAPSGSTLVYGAVTSGNEAAIKPASATGLGKIVLHNTTRGTSLLIDSVDTVTNAIAFTSAVPGAWVSTDTITARSQTNTDVVGTHYFFDIDLSDADNTIIPILATAFHGQMAYLDTSASITAVRTFLRHPYSAGAVSLRAGVDLLVGNSLVSRRLIDVPLTDRKFCLLANAEGSNTATLILRVSEIILAAP